MMYSDLYQDHITKLMCLRIDGASMFQGVKYGIIVLMRTKQLPYHTSSRLYTLRHIG
jgi:hypothetical protein